MKIQLKVLFLFLAVFCLLVNACQTASSDSNNLSDSVARANAHVELGLAYLAQNNAPMAKEKLLIALQEAPSWPPAQDAMAYYLERIGDDKNAQIYYQKAISYGVTNNGAAFNNYGNFLCRQHKPLDAEKMFLMAVSDPNYLNMADAYQNAGYCMLTLPNKNGIKKSKFYFEKAKDQSLGKLGTTT